MFRWIAESIIVLAISLVLTGVLFLVVGSPDRSVPCVQAELAENHVCLATVFDAWDGQVLWVDARSKTEFSKSHLEGAIHIPEGDADNQIAQSEHMQKIGMSGVSGQKLIVYCATDACGGSELVAKKIRDTGFHKEVLVLHGGWKAVVNSERARKAITQ